ncbi:MAG: DUF3443 family protein [Steroidobacterales bacterium]
MSQRLRWTLWLGLCVLAGCGGGGSTSSPSSSSSGSGSSSSSSSGAIVSNVIAVTVGPGPAAAMGGTLNIPYASVKVCQPGTSTCAIIDDVLVDTGSVGLRLMASAVTAAGLTLAVTADPSNASNSIAECLPFADGYTWGPVAVTDVRLNGELASSVSVNIIDDNSSYAATAPTSCTTGLSQSTTSLNSVVAFAANGVLGVGIFDQDCGTSCADCSSFMNGCGTSNDLYFSCNTGSNTCAFTPVALTAQIRNPVALFATDNNGVILELPALPAAGQAGASGTLVFGIATQTNNGLGSAFVLATDGSGNFVTTYKGQTLNSSFIDSGSNGLFFPDSTITVCTSTQSNPNANQFFCPASTQALTAVNQGANGGATSPPVSFDITSLTSINGNFYATAELGGPAATNATLGSYFDWGLPFFYGKNVYTAISGRTAGTATGPFYAY